MSVYRFAGSSIQELEDDLVVLDFHDEHVHDPIEARTTVRVSYDFINCFRLINDLNYF